MSVSFIRRYMDSFFITKKKIFPFMSVGNCRYYAAIFGSNIPIFYRCSAINHAILITFKNPFCKACARG